MIRTIKDHFRHVGVISYTEMATKNSMATFYSILNSGKICELSPSVL